MYFIGAAIILFGAGLTCFFKGVPLAAFLNPPAIAIILFTIIGVIVGTSGFKTFIRGLNAVLSSKYAIDEDERNKAAGLFRLLSISVILASFICLLIGLMSAMIRNPDEWLSFSHSLSASIVSFASGVILSLAFFEPAVYILRRSKAKSGMIREYPKYLGDRLLELCSQNGLTPGDIENATGIELKKD